MWLLQVPFSFILREGTESVAEVWSIVRELFVSDILS